MRGDADGFQVHRGEAEEWRKKRIEKSTFFVFGGEESYGYSGGMKCVETLTKPVSTNPGVEATAAE